MSEYAYLVGLLVAVLAGIASSANIGQPAVGYAGVLVVILGIVVGLMNVEAKETMTFLIATIALVVAGSSNVFSIGLPVLGIGTALDVIVGYIALFAAPAAIVTSVKAVHEVASDRK